MFDNYSNNQADNNSANSLQGRPSTEDIFADLEKKATEANGQNVNSQLSANKPVQFQSAVQQQAPQQAVPAMAVPTASSNGSLKYLIVGLLTLVILLVGGVFVYQMVLVPKIKIAENTVQNIANTPIITNTITPSSTENLSNDVQTPPVIVPITNSADLPNALASSTATSTMPSADLTVKIPDISVNNSSPVVIEDVKIDSDGDGLTDKDELQYSTNPNKIDTDNDGLKDGDEVNVWHTNPNNSDTDGDSYKDGDEVKNGYNPLGVGKLSVKK